jgi:hypothetical protein
MTTREIAEITKRQTVMVMCMEEKKVVPARGVEPLTSGLQTSNATKYYINNKRL